MQVLTTMHTMMRARRQPSWPPSQTSTLAPCSLCRYALVHSLISCISQLLPSSNDVRECCTSFGCVMVLPLHWDIINRWGHALPEFSRFYGLHVQTALDLPDLALQGALGVNSSVVSVHLSSLLSCTTQWRTRLRC